MGFEQRGRGGGRGGHRGRGRGGGHRGNGRGGGGHRRGGGGARRGDSQIEFPDYEGEKLHDLPKEVVEVNICARILIMYYVCKFCSYRHQASEYVMFLSPCNNVIYVIQIALLIYYSSAIVKIFINLSSMMINFSQNPGVIGFRAGLIFGFRQKNSREKSQNSRKKLKTQAKN